MNRKQFETAFWLVAIWLLFILVAYFVGMIEKVWVIALIATYTVAAISWILIKFLKK